MADPKEAEAATSEPAMEGDEGGETSHRAKNGIEERVEELKSTQRG